MASKRKFKMEINNVVSWGATIVIIGLMFKILHWPFATFFITLGLGTEALLFLLLGFQTEKDAVDWTRIYPELDEDYKGDLPKASLQVASNNLGNTAALDKMLADAKIGPELIGSLGDGLRSFSDKVSAISTVSDASVATADFTNKVKAATAGFDNLSISFEKASSSLVEMANSNVDSKAYHDQVNQLARNISALNAVYELELQDSSSHLKSMNKFYQNLSMTMQNFNESMEDSKSFKDEVGKLARNLASLNSIYGNMLSAMNQPRAN
ncbi:MAG: gliding motility protein GldL [Sphingobacteriaceae bacterium]